ncbi:MAG: c-type cytochrome biogenesis protein CcmI [Alphaproteobacteria bacterium]|nr:c-type cytochrome biogenesis protein CcmI [Alphaproteobacteria bacterium]
MWIAIAVLTALAVLSVLWPLLRRRQALEHAQASKNFYQAQIDGIERDLRLNLISEAEAAAARNEAARRLITSAQFEPAPADPAAEALNRNASGNRRKAAMLSILLIPLVAILTYVQLGKPALPDRPLQARLKAPAGGQDIHLAIARIENHLARNPNDAKGWEVLAPVYMNLRRPADAARAWANVVRLAGPNAGRLMALGEALTFASDGKVTPQALGAFQGALEIEPKLAQARFYVGLAAEQAGDKDKAREIWTELLADAPPGADWASVVRERIAELGAPKGALPSPDPQAAKEIAALPPQERLQAIRSMVEGLAARLKDDGTDTEGWLRLIRAYTVLKDSEKARAAVSDARKALGGNPEALKRIDALARELNIAG